MSEPVDPSTLRFAVLAVDVVLFTLRDGALHVRLIPVDRPQVAGRVGFPGGLIAPTETADEAAARLLRDKGGVEPAGVHVEQLHTFSQVDRDPRGRVVSVAYLGLVPPDRRTEVPDTDAFWQPVADLPALAYDHDAMAALALARLRERLRSTNLVGWLLPRSFTLTDLQGAFETVLGEALDKRNFRRKVQDAGLVAATGETQRGGAHRPAALYRIKDAEVRSLPLL